MDYSEKVDEKKAAAIVDVQASESLSDGISETGRAKIIERIKVMNKVNHSTDIDPLADSGSAFIYEKVMDITMEEALGILRKAHSEHYDDVNFPNETLFKIESILDGPESYGQDIDTYELDAKLEAAVIQFHSPYPEVRAVTDPFDDPSIPVETIRAYILGAIWVAIGSFVNEFFYERQPRLTLQSTVLQLFLFPCGKLTQLLPDWGFTLFGTRYSTNPGPWTHKEQMLATIMVNVGSQMSNFMSFTVAMRHEMFFHLEWVDFGFVFLMNFASLFFGYGLAGLARKLAIFPVKAMFPTVLPTLALNRALLLKETKTSINGWTITRQKLFFLTFVASFLYFFIPNYLFKALSTFNWMTWIAPKNVTLALVTGSFLGMGVNPIPTFDWAVINYATVLVIPYFAFINKFIGVILSGIVVMILYWTNHKFTAYLPINANTIYDSTGKTYNLSKIVIDGKFNEQAYLSYSAPYMSAGHIIGTGGLWALYTCAFMYVVITEYKLLGTTMKLFWKAIRHPRRSALAEFDDPHSRMMSKYPEVPDWWFLAIFIIGMATALIALLAWPTTVPVWTVIMIFLFNIAMYIPTVIIYSMTGYAMGFGAFSVILAGYMDPGNAVTNMMVRMWGYNIDEQAESFIADQKIAHYAKLPQRAVFRAQIIATLIQCFGTIGAVEALFSTVKNFCSTTQVDKFVCQFPRTVYSDAIMFGIINPDRVLTTLYPALKHCFYIGPLIAIPFGILKLKYPLKMKTIHPALLVSGAAFWGSTYNYTYYVGGFYMATAFMFYIRRRYTAWWTKYNYILASGLSAGVAFSGIVIFLGLQYTQTSLSWWGNNVYAAGVDYARTASLKEIPPEGFGLKPGEFH
ncbi:OPT oligopeptide transporter protein-domain-containing protein [Lipomyces tetrasporus]|uniref:OPT oligopeptide transporter protein-domain-containing protein n=1 Tax=Lipomyces tetrasporus TaxID=54092 RepID=A0AAD7QYD7_9ASCO|nr:OPT oligopeptide transporter protein-domain-containing protein [Lipomyces tetrasporus]KAJ8103724.1 OPT oligopeptide transporter protein-domain-containing protein [Lipomyces tetrasporus]